MGKPSKRELAETLIFWGLTNPGSSNSRQVLAERQAYIASMSDWDVEVNMQEAGYIWSNETRTWLRSSMQEES
jgi:hypothetical protein